jgi:predicted TIM-barrel fold metal-dependent hydrolase
MFCPSPYYPLSEGRGYTPSPEANLTTYLALAETLGIERMVIVQPTAYGHDHACTLDSVAALGRERARAVAVIDERFTAAALRELSDGGVCAARINAVTRNGLSLDRIEPVARLIAPYGWHLQLYAEPENLATLEPVVRQLPVPVVIDHMGKVPTDEGTGSPAFQALLRLLDSGKCWVKLCGYRSSSKGPPYSDLLPHARALIAAAPERCVWGTDWPHPGLSGAALPDDGHLLNLLYDWAPQPEIQHRILVSNPAQLYGFAG